MKIKVGDWVRFIQKTHLVNDIGIVLDDRVSCWVLKEESRIRLEFTPLKKQTIFSKIIKELLTNN